MSLEPIEIRAVDRRRTSRPHRGFSRHGFVPKSAVPRIAVWHRVHVPGEPHRPMRPTLPARLGPWEINRNLDLGGSRFTGKKPVVYVSGRIVTGPGSATRSPRGRPFG